MTPAKSQRRGIIAMLRLLSGSPGRPDDRCYMYGGVLLRWLGRSTIEVHPTFSDAPHLLVELLPSPEN